MYMYICIYVLHENQQLGRVDAQIRLDNATLMHIRHLLLIIFIFAVIAC